MAPDASPWAAWPLPSPTPWPLPAWLRPRRRRGLPQRAIGRRGRPGAAAERGSCRCGRPGEIRHVSTRSSRRRMNRLKQWLFKTIDDDYVDDWLTTIMLTGRNSWAIETYNYRSIILMEWVMRGVYEQLANQKHSVGRDGLLYKCWSTAKNMIDQYEPWMAIQHSEWEITWNTIDWNE